MRAVSGTGDSRVTWQLLLGSCLAVLRTLPEASVDAVVTSPPYFAQRDYAEADGQLGLEQTPKQFVAGLVDAFSECRRVLKPQGCLWLNLGDSYAAGGHGGGGSFISMRQDGAWSDKKARKGWRKPPAGLKAKDLIGVPWMVAFALRDDGWYLRSDTIWHKPNPMPGSQLDRPTSAHEYCFLLSRSRRYYFDSASIREPLSPSMLEQMKREYAKDSRKDYDGAGVQDPSDTKRAILKRARDKQRGHPRRHAGFNERWDAMTREEQMAFGSLPRSVWTIPTNSHDGGDIDHYALMPRALARKLVISSCAPGGTVLDPFAGAATTGVVALEEGRNFIGIELSPKYHAIGRKRLADVAPLLATEIVA